MRVLGMVGAEVDGAEISLQPAQRQLLAVLVAAGPRGASRDWVAEQIWAGQPPSGWPAALRMALSRLRSRLPAAVAADNGRCRLALAASAVDAWHLLALTETGGRRWDPALAAYLTGEPYAGLAFTADVAISASELAQAQRAALRRLADDTRAVSAPVLSGLRRLVHLEPDDLWLCTVVARIHALSGDPEVAAELLGQFRQAHPEGDAPLPDLDELVAGPPARSPASPGRSTHSSGIESAARDESAASPPSPTPLDHIRPPHLVGRGDELNRLHTVARRGGVALLRGRAASGKTALLAELMHRCAVEGCHVVHLAGATNERVGLAPLTSFVPGFRQVVLQSESVLPDPLARKALLAARLEQLLEEQAGGRRLLLVVDDAHRLDSMTCDVIEYLAHSASANPAAVGLVLSARSGIRGGRWAETELGLSQLPLAVTVDLPPLDEAQVTELVARRRPQLTLAARAQLARALAPASDGLPGVVLAALDGNGTLDGNGAPEAGNAVDDVYDRLVASLDPGLTAVGAAAAVLGERFQLTELAALLGRTAEQCVGPLGELTHRGIVAETGRPGELALCHQLIADALLRATLSAQRNRLHLAASRSCSSAHALARHLVAAGDLAEPAETVAAVLSSARRHLGDGAYWESAAAFRTAARLSPGGLATGDLIGFATALGASGQRARSATIRYRAYDQASRSGDWNSAYDAALSGLPGAEAEDGEPERLAQLLAIPSGALDPERQLGQALQTSRFAAVAGDPAESARWCDRAATLARSPEDRALAALARRFLDGASGHPAERLRRLDASMEGLIPSDITRCRYHQFRCIDLFESLGVGAARPSLDVFRRLSDSAADPVRQWHALVLASTVAETDGDWAAADDLAQQALAAGRRNGIASTEIVFLAQIYFRARLAGSLAALAPAMADIPEGDGTSPLFAAARATVLDAAGLDAEAAAAATQVARAVIDRPGASTVECLAILAPLLGRHGGPGLRATVGEVLRPLAGTARLVGIGIGNLGPLAPLVDSLDPRAAARARIAGLKQAVDLSDRLGMRSWQVRHRLALAAETGSEEPVHDARLIADGTSLVKLIEGATG